MTGAEFEKHKKTILILGSGYVARPVVDYLHAKGYTIIIGTEDVEGAKEIAAGRPRIRVERVDATGSVACLSEAQLCISLLPASLHVSIAKGCIERRIPLVTASYTSPAMAALDGEAKQRGVTILNEMGLDPGLDHLSAIRIIDEARSQGDKIVSFTSWCGGLPAPECADNPFGYKFSWSPRAVLLACLNEAVYLQDGKLRKISGDKLLEAAQPVNVNVAFAFEGIPNRDSLAYQRPYGLTEVKTMLRGTLRYAGYAELMGALKKLDLLSLKQPMANCKSWAEMLALLLPGNLVTRDALCSKLGVKRGSVKANRILDALDWLGCTSPTVPFTPSTTMLDSLAKLMQSKMQYASGERDMAFMQHQFKLQSPAGHTTQLNSSLVCYGDTQYSAMARTVGLPVAMAAEMIVEGEYEQPGVNRPLQPTLYHTLLQRLQPHGIQFKEK